MKRSLTSADTLTPPEANLLITAQQRAGLVPYEQIRQSSPTDYHSVEYWIRSPEL